MVHAFQYDAYQLYVDELPVAFGLLTEMEFRLHPEWNAVVEDFRGGVVVIVLIRASAHIHSQTRPGSP